MRTLIVIPNTCGICHAPVYEWMPGLFRHAEQWWEEVLSDTPGTRDEFGYAAAEHNCEAHRAAPLAR